jgi:Prenyltransferase and squalene oxidase repeat
MVALAFLKAEVPATDPSLQACVAKIKARFEGTSYKPELSPGPGTYEAAATAMVLANLDAEGNRPLISAVASYLISHQNANGSWDYNGRSQGDTSITQYGLLGLWECENAGAEVPPSVWDRAASWYMSVQSSAGSWNYHRDEVQYPETLSMTAAGVGSLLICQRQLERYRHTQRTTSSLLTSLVAEPAQAEYRPTTSLAALNQAANRGMGWISSHFTTGTGDIVGQTPYYMLYGLERVGALADKQTIGRVDWYAKGRDFIASSQQGDGSWNGQHGREVNTVWAMLFLTKSTAKSIRRIVIKRLGAGTLLGGRELPKDLNSLTVAGGRVVSRPMNGAIEGMLAVLEDPRAEQADGAVAGLVDRYYREGPSALRPYKIRFRKMLSDRDPGVRRVAAWALAHTADLDVVPALIDALAQPNEDEDVIAAARMGLELLSRKIEGPGPVSPSTPETRRSAAQTWREWYNGIRPLDLEGQDEDNDAAAGAKASPPKASPRSSPP